MNPQLCDRKCTFFETFAFKKYRDLETRVVGQSRSLAYLDLVPPVLIRTSGDELSPSGTVVGSISRAIPINTQSVQHLYIAENYM